MNNAFNIVQRVQQFRQTMQGQDPDKIIQDMMKNGRLSQSQYEQARQMAERVKPLFSK